MRRAYRRRCEHPSNRSGITRVEVAFMAIAMVVMSAVFLPWIGQSRRQGRRIECQNSMKQLVLALENYSKRHGGQVPSLYEAITLETGEVIRIPWTSKLLADLDQKQLQSEYDDDPHAMQNGKPISLTAFECFYDLNKRKVPGSLSYVANTGYIRADIFDRSAPDWQLAHSTVAIDWNEDQTIDAKDARIANATGVFWPKNIAKDGQYSDNFRMTLDYIAAGDGQSNTLLFAENLQARNWHRADAMHDLGFGVPGRVDVDFADEPKDKRLTYISSLGALLRAKQALPNENPKAKPGTAPRPSSNHLGSCNYGFADGSAKQISDGLDWTVYVRLISPNGQRYGQTVSGLESY